MSEPQKHSIPLIRPERPPFTFWRWLKHLFSDLCSQLSLNPVERSRWIRFPVSRKSISDHPKDQLARAGEEEAEFFLRSKGYSILHKNIRFPDGELDLVTRTGRTLVIVEVKTRRNREHGEPSEAVTLQKQKRQISMANQYLLRCRLQGCPVRFDIISIVWSADTLPQIEHIENAFQVNDLYR
jgi:putative endonuclease